MQLDSLKSDRAQFFYYENTSVMHVPSIFDRDNLLYCSSRPYKQYEAKADDMEQIYLNSE